MDINELFPLRTRDVSALTGVAAPKINRWRSPFYIIPASLCHQQQQNGWWRYHLDAVEWVEFASIIKQAYRPQEAELSHIFRLAVTCFFQKNNITDPELADDEVANERILTALREALRALQRAHTGANGFTTFVENFKRDTGC